MKILSLPPRLADSEVAELKGEFLDERHYDTRVNFDCTGYDESTGNVLFMLIKHALPLRECRTAAHVQGAKQDWVIAGTGFSTIQVNTNVRTKAHTDKGDLSEGFGVISLLTQGLFTGGELIIPRFRLSIASEMTDLLLVNVHEVHANAPVTKFTKEYSRVATVFHYRTGMQQCGTPDEEAECLNNLQLR